jgi:hypothetical protein
MFIYIKNFLLLLFAISLTACSYSPDSLKKLYADTASEYAEEIKGAINPSAQQSAMIDDYTKQLMQWHRRNKLPEYSRYFAKLATFVKQDNIPVAQINTALKQMDAMPHFEQAGHLTYKIAAVAELLTSQQISKIEQTINNQYQQDVLAIKNKTFAQEVMDDTKTIFRFLVITLNSNQLQLIKARSKKFHDIRPYELQAEKQLNKQLISVLRQTNNPNFLARFQQVWDRDQLVLAPKARQLKQQNNALMAGLLKELIASFTAEQKDTLSKQLMSISDTFGEMVYE